MAFVFLFGLYGFGRLDNANMGLLFSDFGSNSYFFDHYVPDAATLAERVFWMESEAHIRDMGCLEWRAEEYEVYNRDGGPIRVTRYELMSVMGRAEISRAGSISTEEMNTPRAERMVEEAVNTQLNEFYYMQNRLEEMPGLYYLLTDGERWIGNVSPDTGADFFRSQPVYQVAEFGRAYERSREGDFPAPAPYQSYGGDKLSSYVAFSSEAVVWQNNVWRAAQRQIGIYLTVIAAPVIAALALIIVLIAGAGRRYGGETGGLNFTFWDKPWLDVRFGVLAAYEFAVCLVSFEAASYAWRYDNFWGMVALCAVLSVFFTLPILGWTASFAKHIKSGKWWRHTLAYVLIHGVCGRLRRFVESLWAGFPLTLRVALVGCGLFAAAVICAAMDSAYHRLVFGFILAAPAVLGMLWYARRLHLLEQGAKAASEGRYDAPIAVTGGELGGIAASINHISDGINTAVAERLKSERLKTELITNISHDIRTPLTSLITYTDLLKSEGLGAERAPEYLEVLIQKSARLKTLTDDLFEASKAASGNIEVHAENLDLADFVRQVLGELDERVRGSGLDFRLSLPERAPVRADGKLLWRVMENLLSNVFKYALAGSRVYIDIVPEEGSYRLDIKNISEHPLNVEPSELMERFKRGDEARSGEGSGLGLSIAQSFVASQGGRFALSIDGDLFKASLYLPEPRRNDGI
jgi:signal transduction histidine kinase